MQRKSFNISGQVQGVGFRPFVFRLAERLGLSGTVRNGPEGVVVELQGKPGDIAAFEGAIVSDLPPLARISAMSGREIALVEGEAAFRIIASSGGLAHEVLISPDVATCADCLADMREAGGRRHGYAFTNCTNCGPRYTITRAMPYDRAQTSMACFPLCPECGAEYNDPRDRRFHAQPNACPLCGPRLWLVDGGLAGEPGPASLPENSLQGDAALRELARRLAGGEIAAVKGLGGFHLVCDALSDAAVERLRRAKERPHKPLAIMVANLDEARRFVRLGEDEERLLTSLERPIVLCPGLEASPLSALISPDTSYIGVMLPYTPLHHLLLAEAARPLVMTSGNRGGEPICLGNREALRRLAGIADVFLLHNRDILIRTDDSVLRPMPAAMLEPGDAALMQLRRARGFVPAPLALPEDVQGKGTVLALGAELKNTLCLNRGREAFVSQHIGDLQNLETSAFQGEIAAHLASVLQVEPTLAVLDAHPDFANQSFEGLSGEFSSLPRLLLQHHFAHAEAVLAENSPSGPALVLALDGTGYAPPHLSAGESLWGGELIFAEALKPGSPRTLSRLASLSLMPLPGGEAAIIQPWRIAHALLHQLELLPAPQALPWLDGTKPEYSRTASMIPKMLQSGLNCPLSSSAGRLFDAVAALLGLCLETSYEGQAAIRLENAQFIGADGTSRPPLDWRALYTGVKALPCPVLEAPRPGLALGLDTLALFKALHEARGAGVEIAQLARLFHWSLAEGLADLALAASRQTGAKSVGLSGGVMQNMSLVLLLKDKLRARGLAPLTHRALPPNDACISFGQAVWALRQGLCPW